MCSSVLVALAVAKLFGHLSRQLQLIHFPRMCWYVCGCAKTHMHTGRGPGGGGASKATLINAHSVYWPPSPGVTSSSSFGERWSEALWARRWHFFLRLWPFPPAALGSEPWISAARPQWGGWHSLSFATGQCGDNAGKFHLADSATLPLKCYHILLI